MIIYADTSAVAKLFVAEPETPDLRQWLGRQDEPRLASSALLEVELTRLLRLALPAGLPSAERFLATDIDIIEITPTVLADAAALQPPRLRTLDAIHLATSIDLGATLGVMLTYDRLLAEAAVLAGITVASPGQAPSGENPAS